MFEHANRINYRIQSLPFYSGIHGLTVSGMGGKAGTKAFDLDFRDGDDQSSMARIRNLDDIKQLDIFRSGSLPTTPCFRGCSSTAQASTQRAYS